MSSPRKILVVDDEPNARKALAELVRDEGFDVDTARDGTDALDKVSTFQPEVVITDLDMPGVDGVELVKRLQRLAVAPTVIVLTSYGEASRALDAMRAGATDYLTKPIRFDELLVVLAKVLRVNDMERELVRLRIA